MSIIGWIVLGALAGWLASIVTKRNDQMGCLTNIAVGTSVPSSAGSSCR